MKYTNKELLQMKPEEVYKLRLDNNISEFPLGFFRKYGKKDNLETCAIVTRYLFEEVLQWSEEDICKKCNKDIFYKYKLYRMYKHIFNCSIYKILNNAYPDRFKPWQLTYAPKDYWNHVTTKKAIIWLIEKKLKWSDDQIKQNLSVKSFAENGLYSMLKSFFANSPYLALNYAYPEKFKPWQLVRTRRNYWNEKTLKEAVIWLIDEKLKWNEDDVYRRLSAEIFEEFDLGNMLTNKFGSDPYKALNYAYPGKYKIWLFKKISPNYWNEETAREATIWLIEKKLKLDSKNIGKEISSKTFLHSELSSMFSIFFNGNLYKTIENAYPGKFKPWQLSNVNKSYWNKETAKEATRWLVEEKLRWNDKKLCKKLTLKQFNENGLKGMLNSLFNNTKYLAIENAYPGKFKPWQFNCVPRNYWNEETKKEAIIWLIEEKLKWTDDEICEKISFKEFKENGLSGMLSNEFGGSIYKALNHAYPGKFKKVKRNLQLNN